MPHCLLVIPLLNLKDTYLRQLFCVSFGVLALKIDFAEVS